jgi:Protein of unknown function (DUF4019)
MTFRRFLLVAAVVPLGLALTALAQTAAPPGAPPAAPPGASSDDPANQPTLEDDKDTIDASRQWLALLDAGKYGAAWDISSQQLKTTVTRAKWNAGIRDARKPFGKLASRKATRFARSHAMPGAPDGDYAVIEFESSFANGKQALEHITWVLEKGEVWRVAGYYIR